MIFSGLRAYYLDALDEIGHLCTSALETELVIPLHLVLINQPLTMQVFC